MKSTEESSSISDKAPRTYRSPLRAEQARQTRARIVTAAAELFVEQGYGATTLQAIAKSAGVSVMSVQLHGPKSALLLAALEQVSTGSEGFDSLSDVPEFADLADQISSPADIIRFSAAFAATSNQRVSKLWLAMDRAAAEDPDVERTFNSLLGRMRADAATAITAMASLGAVRTDRTPDELAAIYWALPLPDLYHRLVEQCGWTTQQYTEWLEQTLRELLLPADKRAKARSESVKSSEQG